MQITNCLTSRPIATHNSKKTVAVSGPVNNANRLISRKSVSSKVIASKSSVKFLAPSSSSFSSLRCKPLRSTETSEALTSVKAEKLGVILLNVGSPNCLEDVKPFLNNIFSDSDFVRLPSCARGFQGQIANFLSGIHSADTTKSFSNLGGSSPLLRLSQDQAASLAKALEAKGHVDAKVYVGMRYWHPFIEETLKQVKADGVTKLVVLPMFPQYSISTTGSVLHSIKDQLSSDSDLKQLPTAVVSRFSTRPAFVKSTADMIEAEIKKFNDLDSTHILFAAQGIPTSYVQNWSDPYPREVVQSVNLVVEELKKRGITNPHAVSYNGVTGPIQYLNPSTQDTIRKLRNDGAFGILAVPISFVTENVNTMNELDGEYREIAEHATVQEWFRTPALGTYAPFIEDLADAVIEAAASAGSVSDIKLEGAQDVSMGQLVNSSLKSWEGQVFLTVSVLTMMYYWIKIGRALAPAFQNLID